MANLDLTGRNKLAALLLGIGGVVLISSACGIGRSDKAPTTIPPRVDNTARIAAAAAVANQVEGLCADVRPFYWEIGDRLGRVTGGSVNRSGNTTVYTATTPMPIASASKWMYAAYVAQRRAGSLTAEDIQFLTFRSGYTNFSLTGCDDLDTVSQCVDRGSNGTLTAANVGRFYYDGGHMQKHASLPAPGMNLGAMANAELAAELRRVLGTEIDMSYAQPQLAGGVRTTPNGYARFLRKILGSELRFGYLLGSNATCTNPATCPTAVSTPIRTGVNWTYSIGHWVESDPLTGDGAFSSTGAFGFYPWINARADTYGIVARVDLAGSGMESAQCGAAIRKAWELAGVQ